MAWAPDYLSAQVLADYLRSEASVDADLTFLEMWVSTASRNVDSFCGRQFGQTALEERFYTPVWDRNEGYWFAEIDDVQDLTGLVLADDDGTVVDADGYRLLPRNAAVKGRPYERVRLASRACDLSVKARFGWNTVPDAAPMGMLLQAARLAKRRESPFGVAGSPSDGGAEIRLLAQLDADFKTSLRPLQRKWWAA
jgi:hypothetical protein